MNRETFSRVLLVMALVLLAIPQLEISAAPAPIYVDQSAAGLNDGTSWKNAYTDLQDALAVATSGKEIWVADGVYTPGTSRSDSFDLVDGVALYGGFPSGGAWTSRNWEHYHTILSGEIGSPGDSSDNCYHVVTSDGVGSATILDGFTIEDGYADGASPGSTSRGGGMFNDNSSDPLVRNVVFRNNYAHTGGGMANLSNSDPLLEFLVFERNHATSAGGGMANLGGSSPDLVGVIFRGNTAGTGTSDSDGGGIYNDGGLPALTNVLFVGNHATSDGGGMMNFSSYPELVNVAFVSNEAAGAGGGIYNFNGTLNLDNSILWDNLASDGDQMKNNTSSVNIWKSAVEDGCPAGTSSCNLVSGETYFKRDPDPGADGDWGTGDDDYGDLRQYSAYSPFVDMGDNSAIPAGITQDLAGNPRIVNSYPEGDGAYVVDLGPYENPPHKIYVDQNAIGANTGGSWYDALTELSTAVNWLRSGTISRIKVAQGTYKPGDSRADTFKLTDFATIYGGYPTYGGADDERDAVAYPTILSGEIGDPNAWTDNCFHVVTGFSNGSDNAYLNGVIISDGAATGGTNCAEDGCGGGVYNPGGWLVLGDVILRDNYANYGGGLANWISSDLTLIQVTFERNMALYDGGGFWNYSSDPSLRYVVFQGNRAIGDGGGLEHNYGDLKLWNTLFVGNEAGSNGHAVKAVGGALDVDNSTFVVNYSFSDWTFDAFYLDGSDLDMDNSINSGGDIVLAGDATVDLSYSMLFLSCPPIPSWNCNNTLHGTSPEFIDYPSNGGDQIWGTADDDYGNLRLRLTSPAIDAGDSDALINIMDDDLDGHSRFADIPSAPDTGVGHWVTGIFVDMGAYETQNVVYLPLVIK